MFSHALLQMKHVYYSTSKFFQVINFTLFIPYMANYKCYAITVLALHLLVYIKLNIRAFVILKAEFHMSNKVKYTVFASDNFFHYQ